MMSLLHRRELLLAAPALIASRSLFAAPATFPAKNIQFIIPYAPGGGFDSMVRFVSPAMEGHLPRRVNVVPINVTAGGGSRGISPLYRAKPPGYTIGVFYVPRLFIHQAFQGTTAHHLDKIASVGCMGEGERYLFSVAADTPF